MRLKDDSVQIFGLSPQIIFAAYVADEVYKLYGIETGATITSGSDGEHSDTSLHYAGNAIDVRTKHLPDSVSPATIAREIKARLNIDFDVLVEPTHIHIEYQPRKR